MSVESALKPEMRSFKKLHGGEDSVRACSAGKRGHFQALLAMEAQYHPGSSRIFTLQLLSGASSGMSTSVQH